MKELEGEEGVTLPGMSINSHITLNILFLSVALIAAEAPDALQEFMRHPHPKNMDKAQLKVFIETKNQSYDVLFQSTECFGCPFWVLGSNVTDGSAFQVNATHPQRLEVIANSKKSICNLTQQFWEDGTYQLSVPSCEIQTLVEPRNPYLPILYAFLALFLIQVLTTCIYHSRAVRKCLVSLWVRHWQAQSSETDAIIPRSNSEVESENAGPVEASQPRETRISRRVKSLDAFRGLAIVLMIFVNYGGGGYWFFAHARWNGLTVADLVFPWFMWIMGVSIAISTRSKLRNAIPRMTIYWGVVRRSCVLFLLGLTVNSIGGRNDLDTLRIPGVLQRFAVCYLVVGILESTYMRREEVDDSDEDNGATFRSAIKDISSAKIQWLIVIILVVIHQLITQCLPLPDGCPTGYVGPGGLHEGGLYANCTGGAAAVADRAIFGLKHIYKHSTAQAIYSTPKPFDPEGILGCLTSILTVYLGVQAGKTLLSYQDSRERIYRWIGWGLILGIIGGTLCGFSKESGLIPINKNLWSLSFAIATSSMAFLLLTWMYLCIDVWGIWNGYPFIYPGMNSILLYIGHEICEDLFPFSWRLFTTTHTELLIMDIWGTGLWVLIGYILFKKRIFLAL